MKPKFSILPASLLVFTLLSGCSTREHDTNQPIISSNPPKDGTIAATQQITTYQSITGTDVKLYKIFYWSNGYKVEAFLTEPAKRGQYPLLINLHGGYVTKNVTHATHTSVQGIGYTAAEVANLANNRTVMIYPEYQGYIDSEGPVMGLKTDNLDIQNAIKVAKSMGETSATNTYVEGYSLGGGLALLLASEDHNIRAVVAVSPFVGLTDFVKWARSNAQENSSTNVEMTFIQSLYGMNLNSTAYMERSPDIKMIQAPVLLLQGTADKRVIWQTVQLFANQMKAAHKTVKFVLYPGGHHGLHTIPYESESTQQINHWFQKYGLNVQP